MQWLKMILGDLERNGVKILQNGRRVVLAVIVLGILIWVGYVWLVPGRWPDWTGFGEYISPAVETNQTFQRGKTLWDLMQLLIIPVILGVGAYLLNESARKEAALQTYLDGMSELLIKDKLRESVKGSEVRAVARARTLTVLPRLDEDRKKVLLRFLYEAGLINRDNTVINMEWANLRGADLRRVYLRGANLSKADLRGADLRGADLSKATMDGANLRMTNLKEADLNGAKLRMTNLKGANLRMANLKWAKLRIANLSRATLDGADLTRAEDLSKAILSKATYTKNAEFHVNTIWPDGFDPDAAGAISH